MNRVGPNPNSSNGPERPSEKTSTKWYHTFTKSVGNLSVVKAVNSAFRWIVGKDKKEKLEAEAEAKAEAQLKRIADVRTAFAIAALDNDGVDISQIDQEALRAVFLSIEKIKKIQLKPGVKEPEVQMAIPFGNSRTDYILVVSHGGDKEIDVILPMGRRLGEGGFGYVSEGKKLWGSGNSKEPVAIKIPRSDLEPDEFAEAMRDLQQEARILKLLHEGKAPGEKIEGLPPAGVAPVGAWQKQKEGTVSQTEQKTEPYDVKKSVFFKNAAYEKSALDAINDKILSAEDALKICNQIATGLAYTHAHHVIHHDMKPGNIMLDKGDAVIIDWGGSMCTSLEVLRENRWNWIQDIIFTPKYSYKPDNDLMLDIENEIVTLTDEIKKMGETPEAVLKNSSEELLRAVA